MGYSVEVSCVISFLNTEDVFKVLFVFLQIHILSTAERQRAAAGVADSRLLRS